MLMRLFPGNIFVSTIQNVQLLTHQFGHFRAHFINFHLNYLGYVFFFLSVHLSPYYTPSKCFNQMNQRLDPYVIMSQLLMQDKD